VDDVTEFVRQKRQALGRWNRAAHRLEQMEAFIFRNSQELKIANQQLHAANEQLLQATARRESANLAKNHLPVDHVP